jgi:hypothetical protein
MVMLQEMQKRSRRIPALPSRRANRETIRRLFQGYVNDFGPDAGMKVVYAIIDEVGDKRIVVPKNNNHRHNNYNGSGLADIWCLFCRLRRDFGEASAKTIMRRFLLELKGMRLTFPNINDLYREERDRRILANFKGDYKELAASWNMSVPGIKRVIKGERRLPVVGDINNGPRGSRRS